MSTPIPTETPTADEYQAEVQLDDANRTRRTRAERNAAALAKRHQRDQAAHDQALADRRAVPSSGVSAVDADPEVAALEQRIIDGDNTVTLDDVETTREKAAGRSRFAALRARAAERKAADDADRAAEARRVANLDAARQALAPFTPHRFTEAYDRAVTALDGLVALAQGHDDEVRRLASLPADQRPEGARVHYGIPGGAVVILDGRGHNPVDPGELVRAACAAAGVTVTKPQRNTNAYRWAVNVAGRVAKDPLIVEQGRDTTGAA